MSDGQPNHHATALRILEHGILIQGPSGSGKTTLALALLARARAEQIDACLIGDDQLYLSRREDKLYAQVPEALAGLVEIVPLGPRPVPYQGEGRIDLIVDLVASEEIERVEPARTSSLASVTLPLLKLPLRNAQSAGFAIWSYLSLPM